MKSSVVPDSSGVEGNTETSTPTKPKQISPAKRWGFVLNNYTEKEISSIVLVFEKLVKFGGFSKEVGESGTPHLQGYVEFHEKLRPRGICCSRIHWGDDKGKPARGTRAENIAYITKSNELVWKKGFPREVEVINPDRDWEIEILDIIKGKPCDRKIYWYYGKGNIGKTSFCKYLTIKHGAIAVGGKGADMRNAIVEYKKLHEDTPELILINIPRSFNTDYFSYEGVENMKDMYFYSGKYEGGMICGNPPHLFIFSNEEPDMDKLSEDRWIVKRING